MTRRVHVDTDLGSNPDDVCALAYLLARPDVEVTGVTTVDDAGGQRAGYAGAVLRLADRSAVPVAAGSGTSLVTGRPSGRPPPADRRYWPVPVDPAPGPVEDAVALLASSVAAGAVVLGIGPTTTLAEAERRQPGLLRAAHVVLMGGWLAPPGEGLPAWSAADDWNVACDPVAADEVRRAAGRLTVVPLAATARAHLRARDLPRLRAAGPLAGLMADQTAAYRDDRGTTRLARAHAGLPDDLVAFLHDPLAAAVAVGWDGAALRTMRVRTAPADAHARLEPAAPDDRAGRDVELVVGVEGAAFAEHWLTTVVAAGSGGGHVGRGG